MFANAKNLAEYTASNGVTYYVNGILTFGLGSLPNGNFKYAKHGGAMALLSYDRSKGRDQSCISKDYAGTSSLIKIIESTEYNGKDVITIILKTQSIRVDVENAISCGEIDGGMTEDQALIQLKKEKHKLDLNLITQDQYNAKKAELSKYIK
jgi:hypothetical protein